MNSKLNNILMSDDVVNSILNNGEFLFEQIPELNFMLGFEHKHPHHHLDVFEHTLLALSKSPKEHNIRYALLLHDIGKPFSYQDEEVRHFRGHASVSKNMSHEILSRIGEENSEHILKLIESHDTAIEKNDLKLDADFCRDLLVVQYCDAMAHNPSKIEKRVKKISECLGYFSDYESSSGKKFDFPKNMTEEIEKLMGEKASSPEK